MGIDLSVCFSSHEIPDSKLSVHEVTKQREFELFSFEGDVALGNMTLWYFLAWCSDDQACLDKVRKKLSKRFGPQFVACKSDHGGADGYVIFSDGKATDWREDDSGSDFVRDRFVELFKLDDTLVLVPTEFPDFVIDEARVWGTRGTISEKDGLKIESVERDVLLKLLEGELECDPVFPSFEYE